MDVALIVDSVPGSYSSRQQMGWDDQNVTGSYRQFDKKSLELDDEKEKWIAHGYPVRYFGTEIDLILKKKTAFLNKNEVG